jgi:hypothetical protein
MSILKETVFIGYDNAIRLSLLEDGVLFQAAYPTVTPTRWVLIVHTSIPIEIDSDVTADAFSWDSVNSVLELKLGSSLSTALDYTPTSLLMYAAEWPNGLVWFDPYCTPDTLLIRACEV